RPAGRIRKPMHTRYRQELVGPFYSVPAHDVPVSRLRPFPGRDPRSNRMLCALRSKATPEQEAGRTQRRDERPGERAPKLRLLIPSIERKSWRCREDSSHMLGGREWVCDALFRFQLAPVPARWHRLRGTSFGPEDRIDYRQPPRSDPPKGGCLSLRRSTAP